ncbi:MAG: hypothetical protein ACFBSD_15875 [Paracoccaceae bacterium]
MELEPFLSDQAFVLSQLVLWFGFVIWFGWSQIRAVSKDRDPDAKGRPSSLAADARGRRGTEDGEADG